MTAETVTAFLAAHGLWLLGPVALVEGPLATLVAGALAGKGTLSLGGVITVATLADLAGDSVLWLVGRHLRHRIPRRFIRRLHPTIPLSDLRRNAGRILVFGKLTHCLGAPLLVASGMARVPFLPFLGFNLAATIPKITAFALLGWAFGTTIGQCSWLVPASLAVFALTLATAFLWLRKHGKPHARLMPDPRL